MENFVSVRIMLDSMKIQVEKCLFDLDLEGQIKRAVEKAIDAFDFDKEVERQVHAVLSGNICRAIDRQIGYIAKEATDKLVREKLEQALTTEILKNA